MDFCYGESRVIENLSFDVPKRKIVELIGRIVLEKVQRFKVSWVL